MGVAKNEIFRTVLHWPIRMWHPHLPSNVKRRSANQKTFRLCCSRLYVTDCVHSGTLEYFLDEHIEKCSINIFWLLSQAVKLRQHGIDCFL